MMPIIALAGYPNCGKSTLFNVLTNSHQSVGNWSGVTVEVKKANGKCGHLSFQFIDLPGVDESAFFSEDRQSSETILSIDKQITQQYLNSKEPTCILNVIDVSTDFNRQLIFTLALLKQNRPVVLALNRMDIALKKGIEIDPKALSEKLGCRVVPLGSMNKQDLSHLNKVLLETLCLIPSSPLPSSTTTPLSLDSCPKTANEIIKSVCIKKETKRFFGDLQILDKFFLHKTFGLPLLFGLMYFVFGLTIRIGGSLQDYFASLLQKILIETPSLWLHSFEAPHFIHTLIEGAGQGLHTTLSFVPVIMIMFFCLSLLESSGYMARAAIVLDKIMQWIGLSGKSFIPMILGFGCNVPAVLATRTLACRRERILTILMSPFMSCSARLAIYALFVTAFFKGSGHNIIFALYCIGIIMALFTGFVLRKTLLTGVQAPLKIDLPPYRLPSLKIILRTTFHRTLSFVTKAGTIIIPLCILFALLGSFNVGENTWLAFFGRFLTPFLEPMGVQENNWPATMGLLTGVVAKEVVVGTLNTLYAVNGEGLLTLADYFINEASVFSYLLFTLLYFPCISVLATISRELNMAWAIFTAAWTTGIAYGAAVLFYQCATFFEHPETSIGWIMIIAVVSIMVWIILRYIGRHISGKKPQKPLPTQILILNS